MEHGHTLSSVGMSDMAFSVRRIMVSACSPTSAANCWASKSNSIQHPSSPMYTLLWLRTNCLRFSTDISWPIVAWMLLDTYLKESNVTYRLDSRSKCLCGHLGTIWLPGIWFQRRTVLLNSRYPFLRNPLYLWLQQEDRRHAVRHRLRIDYTLRACLHKGRQCRT